jgi:hypothetical protein
VAHTLRPGVYRGWTGCSWCACAECAGSWTVTLGVLVGGEVEVEVEVGEVEVEVEVGEVEVVEVEEVVEVVEVVGSAATISTRCW